MSNIFEEVLNDVGAVEEKLLGPDYPYYKYIKAPGDMGMTSEGSLSALGKDINGLVNYVELLVTGEGNASTTGGPLGSKFFLKTGAKCTNNGNEEDRYIYINNVPVGNIPLISSGMGQNFSTFKGLIPGTMSNLNALNPFTILQAFLSGGAEQECQPITMETIDTYNNKSTETHFVSLIDLKNMDPCVFPDKNNKFSGKSCKELFSTMNEKKKPKYVFKIPNDVISQSYFVTLGVLGIYILYCGMLKMKK